jgi:predicted deacetylase
MDLSPEFQKFVKKLFAFFSKEKATKKPIVFVIPAHCHLLDFDSYATCNDVIFSQSTRGFHFLSFECPEN